jgi:tyrosine-protein kinase Etk/Wzc
MNISQNNFEKNTGSGSPEQTFDPLKFLLKYLKYWPFILGSVIIFVGIAVFLNKTKPPIYQVNGKFFIREDNSNANILDLTGITKAYSGRMEQWVTNQAVILKSRPVAERTLSKLDFNVDYFEPGLFTDVELYKSSPIHVQVDWLGPQIIGDKIKITWSGDKTYTVSFPGKSYYKYFPDSPSEELDLDSDLSYDFNFGEFSDSNMMKLKVSLVKNQPEGEVLIQLRSKGSLISEYTGENFQVFPIDNIASVLGITLNVSHPKKGTDYLNTLMEVFLEMELEEKNRLARNTVDFIDSQISGISDSLSYFENNLQAFRTSNRTYNITAESDAVYSQITVLESELSRERFNRDYYENLRIYLLKGTYEQIIAPSGLGITDPTLNKLIGNLIEYQSDRSNLMVTQTEASPRVKEINRKIQDTSSSVLEMINNLLNVTKLRVNDLESRIKSIDRQFSQLPSTEQSLIRIERGRNLNESIFNFLQQRRAEAAISMASNFASNKIVEYAYANNTPIKVKETARILIFTVLGFMLPVVLITIKEVMDKKIKDPKELEESLMVPLIGKIPLNQTKTNLAVFQEPRSAIAESFRAIKTNISFIVPLEKQLTIAVSSTLAGEGKTFTSINLASIYALNNKKTLLISCDMFKPKTFKDFELKKDIGLSNYLSQQVSSPLDIIQYSNYPGLDVILAGAIPPNPSDLLASQKFVDLLTELKMVYDVIVLDTPPVGLISQSLEIIKHVDLIAYMMRYNFSEKSYIEELNDIKWKKGLTNIFAILNAVPMKELTYKGRDYGYYESSKGKRKSTPFIRNKAAL